MKTFAADLTDLTGIADRALVTAATDPEAGTFRIVKDGDGFRLEQKAVYTDGSCRWEKQYFARKREDVEKAMLRRM